MGPLERKINKGMKTRFPIQKKESSPREEGFFQCILREKGQEGRKGGGVGRGERKGKTTTISPQRAGCRRGGSLNFQRRKWR